MRYGEEVGGLGMQHGVFQTVDDAVSAAQIAHQTLVAMPLEKRKEIIANIRKRAAEDVHTLAEMAHEETGLGRVEHDSTHKCNTCQSHKEH